ncbi:VOC family protein [Citreimonas salinaria]|uniref:Glyoxalase/Bleomycin resistance protein/Dioxygenase superfamily protein n=1 Tax=Citreimonas salinaria TaxID=321339 RepID=A0A1H3GSV6_9RHOB|nr:VOC family protein [Citreimonas salinaria]SDY06403.1 Glyoxalase/Bleomycin resistance protein/Dioxygenase superfamily protein [Citreimonas salinaria]
MPALSAILETVLYVDDLDRAAAFFETVMGLPVLHADSRMRTYDVAGRGTLLLFIRGGTLEPVETPGGTIPPHDGSGPLHVAFAIEKAELSDWKAHLADHGVVVESSTDWPRGGQSIYFRDPDGHLLELATPGLWQGY